MSKRLSAILITLVFLFTAACQTKDAPETKLKETTEKLGYTIGLEVGQSLSQNQMELDVTWFKKGFDDGFTNGTPLMKPDEMAQIKQVAMMELRKKISEKKRKAAEENKTAGEKFLLENAKKEGVVTTESGLQYKIIKEGTGPKPKTTDRVEVNYTGNLIDGTEFDSSYKRGKPVEFNVNGVIKGWTEALLLMNPGSKWQLFIPGDLAYGPRGNGMIGPNSTLIFDVELLSIKGDDNSKS